MISRTNDEELELATARMDIMLATNYTSDNPGPLAIIDKYHDKEINRANQYLDFYKDMNDKWKELSNVFKKSCENYKSRIDKITNELNRIIEIIQKQPSKDKLDDLWILDRLDGLLRIVGDDKSEN